MKEKHIVNWFYKHLLFCRRKNGAFNKALTLIELLIAMAIIGILSAIAVPIWTDYITDSRNGTAQADIANIESQIERVIALTGNPPDNLTGITPTTDPWGNPYRYLRIQGLPLTVWQGLCRRDQSFNPLNADYDLYSKGADGLTVKNITDPDSWDDIIRANNGSYIGLASEY
jgi:general secretion pathway protein G